MRKIIFLIFFLTLTLSLSTAGQEVNDSVAAEDRSFADKATGLADKIIDAVTWEKPRCTFSLYPIGGYSPRTSFEFGIMPVISLKSTKKIESGYRRPTTFAPYFMVSTKGMYSFDLDLIAFTGRRWLFMAKTGYLYLPDTYYGIGNQNKEKPYSDYLLHQFKMNGYILKEWKDKWFLGIRLDVNYTKNTDIEGDLLTPDVPGYHGGWDNGLGPAFAFDTRDNTAFPSKGWFVTTSAQWFFNAAGSDYKFNIYNIDIRKFFSIKKDKMVLATQAYMNITDGNTPFYKLSALGGKDLLRGIPSPLKYIDNNAWYVQAEYRQHIWWKLGAVAFIGTGRAFHSFDNSFFKELHLAGGAGLRFKVLPDEGLNLRLDFGMTNRGDNAVYFSIREAF